MPEATRGHLATAPETAPVFAPGTCSSETPTSRTLKNCRLSVRQFKHVERLISAPGEARSRVKNEKKQHPAAVSKPLAGTADPHKAWHTAEPRRRTQSRPHTYSCCCTLSIRAAVTALSNTAANIPGDTRARCFLRGIPRRATRWCFSSCTCPQQTSSWFRRPVVLLLIDRSTPGLQCISQAALGCT